MARKPARLERAGALTPRDRMWAAIRAIAGEGGDESTFSAVEIAFLSGQHNDTVLSYLQGLHAAQYIRQSDGKRPAGRPLRVLFRYALVRDTGVDAPRVTTGGKEVTAGAANESMWMAARVLKEFDCAALTAHLAQIGTPVSIRTVKTYVTFLCRAGYVECTVPSKPGTQARYRFNRARYTGPRSPLVTRAKEVMDGNTGAIVWTPRGGAQ